MKVWIDQSECQNSGLCEEAAPGLFGLDGSDIAHVRGPDGSLLAGGEQDQAVVPASLFAAAEEAARECPGQCIYVIDE
jgi:ferredoxin